MYTIDANNNSIGASWSRQEDKLFEKALVEFPDGVDNRWHRISEFLPGKSPDEVRAHYEALLYDVAEIDSGRVELPCYSDETASLGSDNHSRSRMSAQISFGSPCNHRSRHSEIERKKGTPWTEDEHRYGKGKKERKRSSIHDITTANDSLPMPAPTNLSNQGGFQDFGYPMP
ncbi:hypothetical protein OROMI_006859 [Orobanche minor]